MYTFMYQAMSTQNCGFIIHLGEIVYERSEDGPRITR